MGLWKRSSRTWQVPHSSPRKARERMNVTSQWPLLGGFEIDRESLRRVGDVCAAGFGPGRERVLLGGLAIHDVLNLDASHQQGVGQQRAVATPRDGFSAHYGDTFLPRFLDQLLQVRFELR